MNALYLSASLHNHAAPNRPTLQLAARLRRDDMTLVDIDPDEKLLTTPETLHHLLHLVTQSTLLVAYGLPPKLKMLIAESNRLGNAELSHTLQATETLCLQELTTTFNNFSAAHLPNSLPTLFTRLTKERLLDPYNAYSRVVATEIIHHGLFQEFQKRPDFLPFGRDLMYKSLN